MKYCIFGGSFDPPHLGHQYLAQSACDSLDFDKIFWVPAPDPPHKTKPGTPFPHRVAMTKLMTMGDRRFIVSDIESRLESPSYSIHTIRALKKEQGPDHDWFFLIGADNWAIFPTWHQSEEVLKEVTMVVFPREGIPLGPLPKGVLSLNQPEKAVASRLIRDSLADDGVLAATQLPESIRAYIMINQLYGVGAD